MMSGITKGTAYEKSKAVNDPHLGITDFVDATLSSERTENSGFTRNRKSSRRIGSWLPVTVLPAQTSPSIRDST